MNLRPILLAATVLVTAGEASAALSGWWDSSGVISAILRRGDVGDALKQQPVESITKTDTGYQVKSNSCAVDVTVTRKLPSQPGPTAFELQVGKGQCN